MVSAPRHAPLPSKRMQDLRDSVDRNVRLFSFCLPHYLHWHPIGFWTVISFSPRCLTHTSHPIHLPPTLFSPACRPRMTPPLRARCGRCRCNDQQVAADVLGQNEYDIGLPDGSCRGGSRLKSSHIMKSRFLLFRMRSSRRSATPTAYVSFQQLAESLNSA